MQDSHHQIGRRKLWVDTLRGICMLAVLLDHTELYYTGDNIIDYNLYVPNAMIAFFCVSGYLFFRTEPFSLSHKLRSVARGIIMPYFIFTLLMAVPKAIAHHQYTTVAEQLMAIPVGRASWFVTALAVSEIIFALLLWISKDKWQLITAGCTAAFITAILLTSHPQFEPYNAWNIHNALLALPFIYTGYLYHKHEPLLERINTPLYTVFIFIILVIIKITEQEYSVNNCIYPINISYFSVFALDTLVSTLFLVHVSKRLPDVFMLSWTGSHSIVYYFLAGGIPLLLSRLAISTGFGYDGRYHRVVILFAAVYVAATAATWIIYRYVPFVTGKKM